LRSLIQYYASFESGDFPRARRTAQGMIARDSTDTEAWYQLGEAHYHHGATLFPHADTLGDLGEALFAFERTLAIDSSYVLAYFHITDALGNCADPQARLVCLADSTIYGTPDELTQRVGTDEVARLRQDAADRRVEVGYAWAAEVPGAARPRLELTNMLLEQQRYAEAEAQANRLRESGDTTQADLFRVTALFGQRHYADAADAAAVLLDAMPDAITDFNAIGTYNLAVQAVQTAGRGFPLDQLLDALPFEEQPFGSSVTGERVLIPIATLADAFRQMREENLAEPAYADRDEARRWEQVAGAFITATLDSAAARIIRIQSCGNTYLFARDTTTFVEWIALLPDSACPVMRGHLALARGDTAAARTLESRVASELPQDPNAWNAENAGVAYAWADLLASMGRPREALDVYARLDSVNFSWQATLLVRSWAERAAIHQTLGETQDAIGLYQRVLDVLENADEPNQPFVQRVTAALAAARGETGNVER
jgi:tetratricopeptide (TPR) repeat protein